MKSRDVIARYNLDALFVYSLQPIACTESYNYTQSSLKRQTRDTSAKSRQGNFCQASRANRTAMIYTAVTVT